MKQPAPTVIPYGAEAGQFGELYLPAAGRAPVVVLWHGGFWRMPYGLDQLENIARALSELGYAVWNLEYRRIGAPGVTWRETLDDALAGLNHLVQLAASGRPLDTDRVIVAGHSAGGHLALWVAAQGQRLKVRVRGAIGMAAVSDLVEAGRLHLGNGAAQAFMDASPEKQPDRYAQASPRALLPLGIPQVLLHGSDDAAVPLSLSQMYVSAAVAAGDQAGLRVLPAAGHMEFLDTQSAAFTVLCEEIAQLLHKGITA